MSTNMKENAKSNNSLTHDNEDKFKNTEHSYEDEDRSFVLLRHFMSSGFKDDRVDDTVSNSEATETLSSIAIYLSEIGDGKPNDEFDEKWSHLIASSGLTVAQYCWLRFRVSFFNLRFRLRDVTLPEILPFSLLALSYFSFDMSLLNFRSFAFKRY